MPPPVVTGTALRLVPVVTGLAGPAHITHAGDERLFIVEQPGRIRIVAFHPAYRLPGTPGFGLFWVNYTNTNGDTVIARYTVSSADPQQADPASALTVFVIAQPFANHNGGLNTSDFSDLCV
jgi:hypothetical protein